MKGDQLYEKDKISFNLARLKTGGERFEIVIHPDKAIEYKHGKAVDLRDVLVSDKIFSDAHKGMHASEHMAEKIFKTSDTMEIAKIILQKGEIQLTAEYRDKLREEKRKRMIFLIHRNSIDPGTNLPHPEQRIANALEEAKVRIDEFRSAEDQLQDVVKKLRSILPIRFEIRELQVSIPAQFASKSYSTLKNFGTVLKDEWQNDGSLVSLIELPAGLQQDFFNEINKITHGNAEVKVVRTK